MELTAEDDRCRVLSAFVVRESLENASIGRAPNDSRTLYLETPEGRVSVVVSDGAIEVSRDTLDWRVALDKP